MTLDIAAFVRSRPYAYHLTSRNNLPSIVTNRRIDSAATLILKDGRTDLLRRRRPEQVVVKADDHEVSLRDQEPLHRGNVILRGGWSFDDLVEALNSRVFFWPGTADGPNDYGRRHFGRYRVEEPVIVRLRTSPTRRRQTVRRPARNWYTTTMAAIASRTWTNPPPVYAVPIPSAHSTKRITATVHSMTPSLFLSPDVPTARPAGCHRTLLVG
jgi:uncharacterized protein DUF7002